MDRRRSQGFQLPRVTDGQSTPVHNSMDGRNDPMHVYESVDMPTVDECRIRAAQSQHGDGAEKAHHSHHHRTKHEREQFEDRLRTGQVTQKDIETLHGYLTLEKKEKNVLGDLDTADIEIDVTGRKTGGQPRRVSGMQTLLRTTGHDRKPHEAFVELEELTKNGEQMEWKETARWIKFEENVDQDSNRWGKPHVASLTFHSLLELKKGLEKGTVLLDLQRFDLQSIAQAVVENMVMTDQLKQEDSSKVLTALLLQHRHQHQQQQQQQSSGVW